MSAIAKTQLAAIGSGHSTCFDFCIVTSESFKPKELTAASLKDEIL